MTTDDERRQIGEVQQRLIGLYSHMEPEKIAAAVDSAYRHFDGIRIRDFVPLLVERRAHEALGGSSGMAEVPFAHEE